MPCSLSSGCVFRVSACQARPLGTGSVGSRATPHPLRPGKIRGFFGVAGVVALGFGCLLFGLAAERRDRFWRLSGSALLYIEEERGWRMWLILLMESVGR